MSTLIRAKNGLIINANLATLNGPNYGIIRNSCIAWRDGKIIYIGDENDSGEQWLESAEQLIDAKGAWLTPALIDCHTHLVFACSAGLPHT